MTGFGVLHQSCMPIYASPYKTALASCQKDLKVTQAHHNTWSIVETDSFHQFKPTRMWIWQVVQMIASLRAPIVFIFVRILSHGAHKNNPLSLGQA
jgi:hypothetical protein